MLSPPITLVILDSQNLGANPAISPQGTTSIPTSHPITHAQVPAIIDLTIKGSHGVELFDHLEQDKYK
jgi:hypothetical protein